jgi:hypothetical protein
MDILFLTPFIFSAWSFTYLLQYRVVSGHKRVQRRIFLKYSRFQRRGIPETLKIWSKFFSDNPLENRC